jgi:GNAT superfamily N-acetyltransferase
MLMSNSKSVVNMFHVEKMAPEDFAFAAKLSNTMDWNMTSGDFEFNVKLEPEGCFTLFDGTKRAGVATCINYGRVGWFGNLIVEPAYRHKGAGTQLVKHAVNFLTNREVETIGLYAYPQLVSFYKKLGFKYNVDFQVMKAKSLSSTGDAKMKAAEKQDMPALVMLESRCFGASRRKLLEPILLDQDNLCHVSLENGKITGFAAAKVYGQMAEVGPLVCGRKHAYAAVDLLKSVLEKLQGLEVYLCVPSAENALINLAEKAGFTVEFRVARMFLGSAVAEDCVYVAESLERG